MSTINLADVQGIVFSGYHGSMASASYYLLRIDRASLAKNWIKTLIDKISYGDEKPCDVSGRLHLALSISGMKNLGLSDSDQKNFELPFQDGMFLDRRSAVLGDIGDNDPEHWLWGSEKKQVDLLLIVFSKTEEEHATHCDVYETAFAAAGVSLVVDRIDAWALQKDQNGFAIEHFGFADSISDPEVEGFPNLKPDVKKTIATGEFLLGYRDEYSLDDSDTQLNQGINTNGTYLVFRQLQQHVHAFRDFLETQSGTLGVGADYLAAKILGRWRSGAPIKVGQKTDPGYKANSNDFDFSDDPHGHGCPLGAHIRRANPRGQGLGDTAKESLIVANRHRILRRSRSYGSYLPPDKTHDNEERGLLFICLNASIERQFEFIQQSWINNVKFNGLYDEDDPLTGSAVQENRSFTIQGEPLRKRVSGFQPFVTTRGGAYFFVPSRTWLLQTLR